MRLYYVLILSISLMVGICIGAMIQYEPPKLTIESKPDVEYRIFGNGFDLKKRADKDQNFLLPVGEYLLFFDYNGKKGKYPFVIKKNEDLSLQFRAK